jgi:hypothetical protein
MKEELRNSRKPACGRKLSKFMHGAVILANTEAITG